VGFDADYNAARDYCQSPNSSLRLDEFVKRVAGLGWSIRIESASAKPGAAPPAGRPEERQGNYRIQRAEAVKHPLVHAVIEKLDATVVEVDDNFGMPVSNGQAEPKEHDGPATEE
jgi:hypothetical protein